ncbi:80ebe177-30c2-4d81-96d5-f72492ae1c38 [Thermothielavioides terrestris]|uniref:80ebe177-30c2-4d81-96d5-f72492ae1c38 n=1 Tax=Thermothielavioides terrestris TaxID=2587410 RepID=A0A3S4BLQ3_9PEZI|nr:80ebe177-30c2-4d81-96d5-f72492ae1c38 [Thermothielavioides terrestris]
MEAKTGGPTVAGEPRSTKSADFSPLQTACAHLNAFHVYASDPSRVVEANHYCGHLTEDVRQCLLYDRVSPDARLIGIEYMIKPHLFESLPQDERRLWHSHVFEVKSGMLVMPQPSALVPQAAWDKAETEEMAEVVKLYGKVYHLWQVDRGDKLPLGEPQLMTSLTAAEQLPGLEAIMDERDKRFPGCDWRRKREIRKEIEEPEIHPDADYTWKKG